MPPVTRSRRLTAQCCTILRKPLASHSRSLSLTSHCSGDPFPIDPEAPVEDYQLTVRAIIIGCALGAVVGASNIYLGLKTGFTFGPQLFGALFGKVYAPLLASLGADFASLQVSLSSSHYPPPLSTVDSQDGFGVVRLAPRRMFASRQLLLAPVDLVSRPTLHLRSPCLSSITGILMVSGVPAMYRLNLLSFSPSDDIGKLLALTISTAYFGVAFVIPLRKYFILKQKLVFPTPSATAFTIRSLHSGRAGAIVARKKSWMLLISLFVALCYKVATGYAPGVIFDWHIGWTLYQIGWTSIIALENYGWYLECGFFKSRLDT